MKKVLIGVDLGTTGCRSMMFDKDLNILSEEYIEYPLIKLSDKLIEQDANLWWELVKKSIVEVVLKSKVSSSAIKGISVSSQGIAFVPIDKQGRPLRNAISWLDMRAVKQTDFIKKYFSEKQIFKITGKRISAAYTLPKILWYKENEKEIYDKTYKFLLPHDYIVYKMCGDIVTDHTMASGTMMYDINKQQWSDKILEKFDIEKGKLPKLQWSGNSVGVINRKVAKEMGISNDVIISVGGQDQKCAALGAAIEDKDATISLGTATAIIKKWGYPYIDEEERISTFSYLFKNEWVTEGVLGTTGASFKWLKNNIFSNLDYNEISQMAAKKKHKESNLFFYPHLAGANSPYWYEDACGCYYGITLNTDRRELISALFEGIAFQIKSNLNVIDHSGHIETLKLFGGGSKSEIWCQIIANITGNIVKVADSPETACRGAAILAGIGSRVFTEKTYHALLANQTKEYKPNKELHEMYNKKYITYCNIEKKLWGIVKGESVN